MTLDDSNGLLYSRNSKWLPVNKLPGRVLYRGKRLREDAILQPDYITKLAPILLYYLGADMQKMIATCYVASCETSPENSCSRELNTPSTSHCWWRSRARLARITYVHFSQLNYTGPFVELLISRGLITGRYPIGVNMHTGQ